MDSLNLPEYTLRFHKSSVTCLLLLNLSQHVVPSLVSADAKGSICLWDLITRRPKTVYRIEGEPQIIALQYVDHGLLAVLDRHHKLRLLKIDGTWEQVYEIPVNTLNFANFLVQKTEKGWYRLICCNTQDSESLDIYEFHLSSLHSLKRINKGLKFYEAVKSSSPLDQLKLDKLGIVMKFAEWNDTIYCGMESGIVIGFKVTHEDRIKIVYLSHVHYPNPILDLSPGKGCLLSSSTDDKIGIHGSTPEQQGFDDEDETNLGFQRSVLLKKHLSSLSVNFQQVPTFQIGHVKKIDKFLILSNWNGESIVTNNRSETLIRFSKPKSSVRVNENPQGNQKESEEKPFCKVCSLEGLSEWTSQHLKDVMSANAGQRRRIAKLLQRNWCIIGYDDGNIAFHRL